MHQIPGDFETQNLCMSLTYNVLNRTTVTDTEKIC